MQTIHINLVSEQLIPNLIPTFADPQCCGVILVLGDDRLIEQADRLTQLYQGRGLPILWRSQGSSSHRLQPLQQQATALLERLEREHGDKSWILNATGGTKPMALAFANAFNRYNASRAAQPPRALIIYTDTQNREIPLLNEGVDFALPYHSVLNLDEMLAANGFKLTQAIDSDLDEDIQQRAELTRFLARQFSSGCQGALNPLLAMATTAGRDFPLQQQQTLHYSLQGDSAKLYQRLVREGLLEWDGEGRQVRFLSVTGCRYLSGGWLEELTYLTALECKFDGVFMSVEGEWLTAMGRHGQHEPHNEFDVLIVQNNQLLTIECKASNWFSNAHADGVKNQDILHKLDALGHKLGGFYGTRLLVTAQRLTDPARARAREVKIALCEQAKNTNLKQYLLDWKGSVS